MCLCVEKKVAKCNFNKFKACLHTATLKKQKGWVFHQALQKAKFHYFTIYNNAIFVIKF